jgi:hypothetical protein
MARARACMLPTATVDSDALSLSVAGSTDASTVRDTLVRLDDAQVSVANLHEYLAYITPAILLMAAASATQMIAVWISMDMSEGIIARFRTMAIARSSVLAGHVYGGTILITVSIAALLGFALLLGHRPQADALDRLALAGLVVVVGF